MKKKIEIKDISKIPVLTRFKIKEGYYKDNEGVFEGYNDSYVNLGIGNSIVLFTIESFLTNAEMI